ncbi:hypothetical protein BGW39_002611 [Mortierella sp. 14UC]|nr:hypothetical protein BGW39_002611 [Mortierella sp. 14UC]
MASTPSLTSAATTTTSACQEATPLRVNFARPTCFCGFTAVSIYPEPTGIGRRTRSAAAFAPPPTLKTTNWVYECHFSPKQRGMVPPDPCEDCEKDRQRRATRGRLLARNTKDLSWFTGSPSIDGTTTPKRHKTETYDQVELWPRKNLASATTTTTTRSSNVLGADIHTNAIYLNAAPMDGSKVCGFHMHALEWHHMQTLSVDQILTFAKNTPCDVFHLSVIRWLGDLANTTIISNCDIDTNFHLGLKLFQKVGCFCKKEAALAKGPRISTLATSATTPSSLLFPGRSTTSCSNININKPSNSREYFIMCAGRVYDNHSAYEMVPQPGEDSYYSYNIRSWVKKWGGFFQCTFQLPLQKAIFTHTLAPLHSRIYANNWLSQWLEPTSFTPRILPDSSSPGSFWFQRTSELLTTVKDPSSTTTKYVASRVALLSLMIPSMPQPLPSPSSTSRRLATVPDLGQDGLTQSTHLLAGEGQTQERDHFDTAVEYYDIDNELQEALSCHAEVVKSIKEKMAALSSQIQEQEQYLKEINMDTFPSVSMLLCDKCRDNETRNFCVVPRAGFSSPLDPLTPSIRPPYGQVTTATMTASSVSRATTRPTHLPSPEGSDEVTPNASEVPDFFDLLDHLTGLLALDAELSEADRKLERTLARHAQTFERTMEVRSRLVPDFLLCQACSFREMGVDVLPCQHHFLCTGCFEQVEFYLVPYVVESDV